MELLFLLSRSSQLSAEKENLPYSDFQTEHGNPGIVSSSEAVPILLKDRYVLAAMELFEQVSVALVGIGTPEPSRLLASSGNLFSSSELNMLRDTGAVGTFACTSLTPPAHR